MSPGVTGPNTFTTHFVAELTKLDHMQFNIVYIYIYMPFWIYMDSCSYRVSMDMFNPLCFWQSVCPIPLLVSPLNT